MILTRIQMADPAGADDHSGHCESRKPEAKRFRKWLTGEVLPSIRRTGNYGASVDSMALLADPSRIAFDAAAAGGTGNRAD